MLPSNPRRAAVGLVLLACSALFACSDSSNRQSPTPELPTPPEPPVETTNLDDTGIYRGTIVTDQGDLALVRVTLARDGQTSLAIESGDSEQPDIVLWGVTEEANGTLDFTGTDSRDGSTVELTLTVDDEVLTTRLRLDGLAGDASATKSDADVSLPAGRFARQDTVAGLTEIEIEIDGSIKLLAPCDGSGEFSTPDEEVNIHRITVTSDCLELDALASAEPLAGGGYILLLTGENGLATRLYQP